MFKSKEFTGKTENIAIENALKDLGLERDSVSVEIISRAKAGFLGFGSQPARIKVTYEVADPVVEPVKTAAPVEEPVKTAPVVQVKEEVKKEVKKEIKKAEKTAEQAAKKVEKSAEQAAKKAEKAAEQVAKKAEKAVEDAQKDVESRKKKSNNRRNRRKPDFKKAEISENAEANVKAETANTEPMPEAPDMTEAIIEFLTGLMKHLDVAATPAVEKAEDNIYRVELQGENLGAIIGHRGETLDAIQQLTNYSVNKPGSPRVRVHIDAEHYRSKREESLQRLAQKTADKAIKYRRNMMLEPMNAYERHVIHSALQEYDARISTYSTGTEPNRRIVVAYNGGGRNNGGRRDR